jgi:hypothetical protein
MCITKLLLKEEYKEKDNQVMKNKVFPNPMMKNHLLGA